MGKVYFSVMARGWRRLSAGLTSVALACGAGDDGASRSVGVLGAALSLPADSARILGFEEPSDWSPLNQRSDVHSEGSHGLAVTVNGWTDLVSRPIAGVGDVSDEVKVDLRLPAAVGWGEARIVVVLPSAGEWWRELGSVSLAGNAPGTFHTLTWSLPPDLGAKLAGSYTDLRLHVIVNAPAGTYLLDRLRFAEPTSPDGGDGGSGGAGTTSDDDANEPTVSFSIPDGFSRIDLALVSETSLLVGNGVEVLTADEDSFAPVSNAGSGELEVGTDTVIGSLTAAGPVDLRDRARVDGNAISGDAIALGVASEVTGSSDAYADPSFLADSLPLPVPDGQRGSLLLEPDEEVDLEPGAYGVVHAKSRDVVTMHAGDYAFDALYLEPESRLILDSSEGPIFLTVRSDLMLRGTLEERGSEPGRVLWGYLGESRVTVETPFRGTLLAPNASVWVGAHNGATHRASFFAEALEIESGARIVHTPFSGWLIRTVEVHDAHVCAGEPFRVTVEPSQPEVDLSLSGARGAEHWLTFDQAGTHSATVTALLGTNVEVRTLDLTVVDCPEVWPVLTATLDEDDPLRVSFSVTNEAELAPGASFNWDFGDGIVLENGESAVTHSYARRLAPGALDGEFPVRVEASWPSGETREARVRLHLFSLNGFARSRGIAYVHARPLSSLSRIDLPSSWLGVVAVTLQNDSNDPVTLDQRVVELIPCDDAQEAELGPLEDTAIELPAWASRSKVIAVTSSVLPQTDVCMVGIHLRGHSGALTARASFVVPVAGRHFAAAPVQNPELEALLNQLAADGASRDDDEIPQSELTRLAAEAGIPVPPVGVAATQLQAEGEECDPADPPRDGLVCIPTEEWYLTEASLPNARKGDAIFSPGGLQGIGGLLAALDPPEYYSHSGIMTRSHVELTHSTASAERMAVHVKDEVSRPFVNNDHIEELFRWGWPGNIRQTVEAAYNGEFFIEPEPPHGDRESFEIRSFGLAPSAVRTPGGGMMLAPPLVLSPNPFATEVAELRQRAAAVADSAAAVPAHYRFYTYSHADEAPGGGMDGSGDWASDTFGTVCSALIWQGMRSRGENMSPPYCTGEAPDPRCRLPYRFGPAVSGWNGLYHYDAAERLRAAAALYDEHRERIAIPLKYYTAAAVGGAALAGPTTALTGSLTVKVAEGVQNSRAKNAADRLVNCFASDDCDSTSGRWRRQGVGEGKAISPDGVLQWRDETERDDLAPEQRAGLYEAVPRILGYAERVFHRRYRWAPAGGTGTLRGRVMWCGPGERQPAEGAAVLACGQVGHTLADGSFSIDDCPVGTTEVKAYTDIPFDPTEPDVDTFMRVAVAPDLYEIQYAGEVVELLDDLCFEGPDPDLLASLTHWGVMSGTIKMESEFRNRASVRHETCTFAAKVPMIPTDKSATGDLLEPTCEPLAGNTAFEQCGPVDGLGKWAVTVSCREEAGARYQEVRLQFVLEMQSDFGVHVGVSHKLFEGRNDWDEDDHDEWSTDLLPGGRVEVPRLSLQNPEYGDTDNAHLEDVWMEVQCPPSGCLP